LALSLNHIFIAVMRKANNGADEQEEHSELGVHFITPTSHKSPVLLLPSPLAVIDEDQKHIDDDASLPVRFILQAQTPHVNVKPGTARHRALASYPPTKRLMVLVVATLGCFFSPAPNPTPEVKMR
jgi:hypothetical protein